MELLFLICVGVFGFKCHSHKGHTIGGDMVVFITAAQFCPLVLENISTKNIRTRAKMTGATTQVNIDCIKGCEWPWVRQNDLEREERAIKLSQFPFLLMYMHLLVALSPFQT